MGQSATAPITSAPPALELGRSKVRFMSLALLAFRTMINSAHFLDRFDIKLTYYVSPTFWSIFTLLHSIFTAGDIHRIELA